MITRPVRERSHHRHRRDGRDAASSATGFEEVGLLSLSSADHSEIAEIAKGLADRYEGTKTSLSLPSHPRRRVQHRPGQRALAQRPPVRADLRARGRLASGCASVINKMVTEEDLIRTVSTAYAHGWRQVKLYFMCGLPTETDEDVLQIAEHGARRSSAPAARPPGSSDIRCTVLDRRASCPSRTPRSSGPPSCDHETTDARLRKLRDAINADRSARPRDRLPLPRRQAGIDRGPALPRRPSGRRGDRAGVARRRPVRRLERALLLRPLDARPREAFAGIGVDVDWYTTRERDARRGAALGPPRLGPRQGVALGRLAGRAGGRELDDCRWTPCFDCGVCPTMGTEIQIGPTGRTLLPLTPVESVLARS